MAKIEILHGRDPDSDCDLTVWVDGVRVEDVTVEDIDPGRGYTLADWRTRQADVETSDYSPAFKAAVLAELAETESSKYIEDSTPLEIAEAALFERDLADARAIPAAIRVLALGARDLYPGATQVWMQASDQGEYEVITKLVLVGGQELDAFDDAADFADTYGYAASHIPWGVSGRGTVEYKGLVVVQDDRHDTICYVDIDAALREEE